VAFEVDSYDPDAGEAWSVVIKGYAIEIEQMHQYLDALDLPLFPGMPDRNTGSCESNRSRSPDADSTSSAPKRREATAQTPDAPQKNNSTMMRHAPSPWSAFGSS